MDVAAFEMPNAIIVYRHEGGGCCKIFPCVARCGLDDLAFHSGLSQPLQIPSCANLSSLRCSPSLLTFISQDHSLLGTFPQPTIYKHNDFCRISETSPSRGRERPSSLVVVPPATAVAIQNANSVRYSCPTQPHTQQLTKERE